MNEHLPTTPSRQPAGDRPRLPGWVVGAATAVWLAAVAAGFVAWDAYDATPGPQADGDATGPAWTLTLFAHPHCPCTRASLTELDELARTIPGPCDIEVVFVLPAGVAPGWERTASWDAAAAIPGASVRGDLGGVEAVRAGAVTSGHTVLTDGTGRVVFRGGLTRARGRTGESAGRKAVCGIVAGECEAGEAPVFGCPMLD